MASPDKATSEGSLFVEPTLGGAPPPPTLAGPPPGVGVELELPFLGVFVILSCSFRKGLSAAKEKKTD